MENVDCNKCIHYYVTWDANNPRGCKVYGFKSRQMPNAIVRQTDVSGCQAFESKSEAKKKKDGIDLNSDDLW